MRVKRLRPTTEANAVWSWARAALTLMLLLGVLCVARGLPKEARPWTSLWGIGEASHPGPAAHGAVFPPEGFEETLGEDWTPAWKRWSVPVVRPGAPGGGICIDLVPPHS